MSKQTIKFLRKFEHEPLETSHDDDTTSTAYQQLERAYTNLQDSYGQAIKDRDFWHNRYAHETNEVQRFKDKAAAMGLNTDLSRKMQEADDNTIIKSHLPFSEEGYEELMKENANQRVHLHSLQKANYELKNNLDKVRAYNRELIYSINTHEAKLLND